MSGSRRRVAVLSVALAAWGVLGPPPRPAPAGDAPAPPGFDAWSERVLQGAVLGVGPRSAARAPDGRVHLVYGGSVLRHAWLDVDGWRSETLDAAGGRGFEPSLAFDRDGHLHVAYADPTSGALFVGTDAGGSFTTEQVVPHGATGPSAIAVGDDGVVCVVWRSADALHFADDASGALEPTTLATDVTAPSDVDLALDADGVPHVVYQSGAAPQPPTPGTGPRAFVHLARTDSVWTRDLVETTDGAFGDGVGRAGSIARAPDGALHAVFRGARDSSSAPHPMRHGVLTSEGWTVETMGAVAAPSIDRTHVAFDDLGEPLVAAGNSTSMAYVRRVDGTWQSDFVGSGTQGAAIAESGGLVHVGWYESRSGSGRTPGVHVATAQAGGSFADDVIDRSDEAPLTLAVAGAPDGASVIAALRRDAQGVRVDVLRREGGAWSVETVARDVVAQSVPALRVAADGTTHLAFGTDDGRVLCASDGGGGWALDEVATGVKLSPGSVALALAPDGARRVLFPDSAGGRLRAAFETAEGWELTDLESTGSADVNCALAVSPQGVAHAVWMVSGYSVYHRERSGDVWSPLDRVAEGYWDALHGPSLALGAGGDPWVALGVPWQFGEFTSVLRRESGGWTSFGGPPTIAPGEPPWLGFASDGSPRIAGGSTAVLVGRGDPTGKWTVRTADAGAGVLRGFLDAAPAAQEGKGPTPVGVGVPRASPFRDPVASFAADFDAGGALHGVYVDPRTGDVRLVTERPPAEAPATVDVTVTWGTASADDATVGPARLRWAGPDDSGTKYVTVDAPEDSSFEGDETLSLDLHDATGGVFVDPVTASRVVTVLDEFFPPPDPAPPPPATGTADAGAYFLPLRARRLPNRSYAISGVLHAGSARFDPSQGVAVTAAGVRLEFPVVRGGRTGTWTARAPGGRFTLRRDRLRPTMCRFDLRIPRGAPEPDLAARAEFELACGSFVARSVVNPEDRRIDLARRIGAFTAPGLHLLSYRASPGEAGTASLAAWIGAVERPSTWKYAVRLSVAPGFVLDVPAEHVRFEDDVLTAEDGGSRIVVDYARRTLEVAFAGVVADVPDGSAVTIDLTIGPAVRVTLRTRVSVRRGGMRG